MKFLNTFSKCGLLVAFLMLLGNAALAQRAVKGKVTDADSGEPLIGASVSVVGTTRGTATDIDGNFVIDVPTGSTQLRCAYTGYTEQVITLGTSNMVDFALKPGSVLDEVVVIGYGVAKKSDLTGSVASVNEKNFNKGLVTAPDQLIQGKIPGVQVINNSGQPGGATTVRIRGNSSIRAGQQPLYVVDGIQQLGASNKPGLNTPGLGNSAGSNPLNYLNPNDIESIEVLKDASATAIYGSRGANGVVLITTKRAKSGVPTIDFNTYVGGSSILKKYDVLSGDEYRAALSQYGLTGGNYGTSTDAFSEILRTGLVQNHGVTISGGNSDGNYRIGLGYLDQDGIIKGNDFRRLSANVRGNYKFLDSKKLAVEVGLLATQTNENAPSVSTDAGFQGNVVAAALQWNPTASLYNEDGSPVVIPPFGNTTINPMALLDAYRDNNNGVDILASIAPSYKITDNLTYKFELSQYFGSGVRRAQIANYLNFTGVEGRGFAAAINTQNTNRIMSHTLNYLTTFGSGMSLNATVGYEYQKRTNVGYGVTAQDFQIDDFDYTNILQNSTQGSRNVFGFSDPDAELQSYFVRALFNIKDKYLINATMRADGSSKFGENNKYGYFPAVGVAWNLHKESFLEDGPFDNLKVRASWGQTGNSEFPPGAAQDRYGFGLQTIGLENVANPDLKWETSTTLNVGIDYGFLNNKIYGSLDYFSKQTEDLLFQFPTIQPAPAGFYWINLPGTLTNSGIELSVNALLVDQDKFNWNLGLAVTSIQNELSNYTGPAIDYGQLFGQGSTGAVSQRLANGQPLNAWYLRQYEGLSDAGQSIYTDNEALAFVGDPNSDLQLGVTTSLNMDKFTLDLSLNGEFGHTIYNNTKMSVIPIGNLGTRNIDANLIGGDVQEATSNAIKGSTRYLEAGDYMKLTNTRLSYNIGNLGKSVRNAVVYVQGTNLLVFTNYSGFDPEVNTVNNFNGLPSYGIEYIPYPSARTILVGANFSF
ncbi:MAG: SusC/RagA family TonB-linked outer membrane protein [Saprospiraceae bacterium]|nr:SusC/RagA family TonB-linked outer membrane protein [Saprospiraceae bacterium]